MHYELTLSCLRTLLKLLRLVPFSSIMAESRLRALRPTQLADLEACIRCTISADLPFSRFVSATDENALMPLSLGRLGDMKRKRTATKVDKDCAEKGLAPTNKLARYQLRQQQQSALMKQPGRMPLSDATPQFEQPLGSTSLPLLGINVSVEISDAHIEYPMVGVQDASKQRHVAGLGRGAVYQGTFG
jgi:hypothetical protein